MTLTERKKRILCNMGHLLDAREYLLTNNKSLEAQREIRDNRIYDGYLIEIESPLVGGTDADWIRLCYDDVYLFLHDDGTEEYRLDPLGEYGGELINVRSYDDFVSKLKSITYDLGKYYEWDKLADSIVEAIRAALEKTEREGKNKHGIWMDSEGEIVCKTQIQAEGIADFLEDLGFDDVRTGYYDPEEDKRDGVLDEYTGKWYVDWE